MKRQLPSRGQSHPGTHAHEVRPYLLRPVITNVRQPSLPNVWGRRYVAEAHP